MVGGGREPRDSPCAGFYLVCAVGSKIFCLVIEDRWLGGRFE